MGFNPNVIPLLYLNDYKELHYEGEYLLQNREMFVSQRAYHSFIGYTKSQLSEIQRGLTGKYGLKRKTLIEKHGYDTKFAYHTMRLLEMIYEFLITKEMNVYRGEQIPELMSIRNGEWSKYKFFYEVQERLDKVEKEFRNGTWLPGEPDTKRANEVCMEIIRMRGF